MILTVNGVQRDVVAESGADLLTILRNNLNLTGSKYACGEGVCGACTVHIDGKPVRSCVIPVDAAIGKKITTIEGVEENDGTLHYVQKAFLEADPFQCSFCASGMIMSAVSLLDGNSSPSDDDIISAMNGNICRCGTYPNIIKAIKRASKSLNSR